VEYHRVNYHRRFEKEGIKLPDDANNKLPIRSIKQDSKFVHKNEQRGRSEKTIFVDNEEEFKKLQQRLGGDIDSIVKDLKDSFDKYPEVPSIIKAKLRDKALAKSHRPTAILNSQTCPIIGAADFGELLLGSTSNGLKQLKLKIAEPYNHDQKANVSALENLSVYGPTDKLLGLSIDDLTKRARRGDVTYFKVTLFNHHKEDVNSQVIESFQKLTKSLDLQTENLSHMKGFSIWRITGANTEQISKVISHPSVRAVSFFPAFKVIFPKNSLPNRVTSTFPVPVPEREYPIVAVVDSGISKSNPYLSPWIVGVDPYVPVAYENREHGTFVAGLVCMADKLNDNICEDFEQIQLLDIHVLPNPLKEKIYEDDIIQRLSESVPKMLKMYRSKIWNMSLGLSGAIDDESFSSLSVFLDELQDEYNVIFVVPAGNYEDPNQRSWPPQSVIGEADRLQIPGDSVRALTVGAIAFSELPDSIVKRDQPASYSCRGPGPAYIIKPELVHYSGNLSNNGRGLDMTNQGVRSFNEAGDIIEGVGTSYSVPLVARSLSILHKTLDDSASESLLRALIVHNSYPPNKLSNVAKAFHYIGFGKPAGVREFLTCDSSSVTLVFDHEIRSGHTISYKFDWPKSLIDKNGNCRGKVRMTLVAKAPLDSDFGSEYIRGNVSASLRSLNSISGRWTRRVTEYPTDFDPIDYYESELVKNGYKWKPIKRYEKDLKRVKADEWEIEVKLLLRSNFDLNGKSVKFALVFTLSDPDNTAPVYNEVVLGLQQRGIVSDPIQIRSRFQARMGS
jgi:hypothetical protein